VSRRRHFNLKKNEFFAHPCPFCGGRPVLLFTQPFWVRCDRNRCTADGPSRSTPAAAVKAWNKTRTYLGAPGYIVSADLVEWQRVYGGNS
jgi:hypothetical protein